MKKSTGHIMFCEGKFELFVVDKTEVYRASISSEFDAIGYRMGKRWECSVPHFNHYGLAVFGYEGKPISKGETAC